MSQKIRQALNNCQEKETALQRTPEEQKIDRFFNPGIAAGMITAGVVSYCYSAPSLKEHIDIVSQFSDMVVSTYPNAGSYALGTLALAGIAMLGLSKLERKDQEIAGAHITADMARDIRQTATSVMNINETLSNSLASRKTFGPQTFVWKDEHTVSTLKSFGFDPSDKAEMARIQKAYCYGLAMASIAEAQNIESLASMTETQRSDFIDRKIVEAMVERFEKEDNEKGMLATAKDKIREAITGNEFNPHEVARASVKAVNQVMSRVRERNKGFEYSV